MKKALLLVLLNLFVILSVHSQQCGGTFTDPAGLTANYANNSDYTVTICPTNPGDVVTVTFTSFNTEATFDVLYVYNGNSTAAPQLTSNNPAGNNPANIPPGGFWGTAIPGPFTSTSPDGCLTFRFRSDTNNTLEGWDAIVSCAPSCDPPSNPASLFFCDPTGLPIYNLNDANAQISNGATGLLISYHETLTDAQIGTNPVGPEYIPLISPGVQVLHARVTNQAGCFSITTLTLNTQNCGSTCPAPTNLVATNLTDTSFTLNWINSPGSTGIQFSSILVLPFGSPEPTPSSTGFLVAASNSFTITGLSPDACYSVYVKSNCSTNGSGSWSAPLNICMPNCADSGNCSQALILNAFLDTNNNGLKDTGEVNFNTGNFVYQVNDSGSTQFGTTNNGSYYIFDSNPSNSYDISFAVNADFNLYYTSGVTQNNITLPTGSGAQYLYFPIINVLPHVDAQVNLFGIGQPRPGFSHANTIYYQNNGSQTISNGTITFTKATNVSITAISQTGTTPTASGFTYDFTNLAPFEVRSINVNLLVPVIPTVTLGDLVTNTVTLQIANDINLSNNSSTLTQTIVGSYDPNDKMESHGEKIVHSTFTANDYLYYTIRFENTGTANAEFVIIKDELVNQLNPNTFEMIAASHNVNTKREGNQLSWHFYNINLPPTSINPIASHGYVYFRIKPANGYAVGDSIPNFASIFFDYNPPIVTDTFYTEFVQALSNATFNATTISLFPNPANDLITITNNNSVDQVSEVNIHDITGKLIYSLHQILSSPISINVSNFAKGLYLVELTSDNNTRITKKLIIQ